MVGTERERFPAWAEQQRRGDLAWIGENLHVLWPAASTGYDVFGRGAVVVDTTIRPTGEGHPFACFPQVLVGQMEDLDAIPMVGEYDPLSEMVTVVLKEQERISSYRIAVFRGR